MVLFAAFAASCRTQDKTPQAYGALPDFSLPMATSAGEGTISRADLAGRAWIAGFIFTNCYGPCPMITKNMAKLQSKLPERVGFLSFTIDPARDGPKALRRYAEEYGADPGRWRFVTGKKAGCRSCASTASFNRRQY
jgi:cytochrome oxidase Cu insertion factor (SCO1/SenC/PrrC family)